MAKRDRLVYAQNWEDPKLEMQALAPASTDTVVAIAGGGCTVLSLLALGPARVIACDLSEAQLRVTALKRAAVVALGPEGALEFLGGWTVSANPPVRPGSSAGARARAESWPQVARNLGPADRAYWDARPGPLRAGILGQGRAELFLAVLGRLLRTFVHPRRRIQRLFEQPDLESQRRFYHDHWDTPGWRFLFKLLHKRVLDRALDPSFYRFVNPGDLGEQFRSRAERCLLELPARENYFLARMFLGGFLPDPNGRPPYLQPREAAALATFADRLELHPTRVEVALSGLPADSVDKFYLSNVTEWLPETQREALFAHVVRTGRVGATVVWRALMVDRPVPVAWADQLVEDPARSAALGAQDRAFVNTAFHVARVHK